MSSNFFLLFSTLPAHSSTLFPAAMHEIPEIFGDFLAKLHLTDIAVKNLKAQPRQRIYWDEALPCFGCRISQKGAKAWVICTGRERKVITIGRYPVLALKDARAAAKRLLAQPNHSTFHSPSFAEALDIFIAAKEQSNRPRTAIEYKRLLRRHFLPRLRNHPLNEISTQDIVAALDRLQSTPSEQRHALVVAKIFFRWCYSRAYIETTPCGRLQVSARAESRDRVLDHGEIAAIWHAAQIHGYPFGHIVKLLLLTGQRRNEITSLKWGYIDEASGTITLPASLTKNKREHTLPCGEMARAVIASVPALGSVYLFPARGYQDRPYCGWSKGKRAFDRICPVAPWTLHDLRRTYASSLAALQTPPHVIERMLNHASGTISGVAAVYNKYAYMDEMRHYVSLYEAKLLSLIS